MDVPIHKGAVHPVFAPTRKARQHLCFTFEFRWKRFAAAPFGSLNLLQPGMEHCFVNCQIGEGSAESQMCGSTFIFSSLLLMVTPWGLGSDLLIFT
mmetsp:Transcript_6880/g.14354  ORF Transcript_6880/g.14354 Transcript_6880/m.14354 type:complete len:96 (-) Transcript_6880:39-326(-)